MRQAHPFIQRYYKTVRYKLVRENKCGAEIRRKTQQIEIMKGDEPSGRTRDFGNKWRTEIRRRNKGLRDWNACFVQAEELMDSSRGKASRVDAKENCQSESFSILRTT